MTQSQLEGVLWDAGEFLRGHINSEDFKHYIFPLLFYKRICDTKKNLISSSSWSSLCEMSTDLGEYLKKSFQEIEDNNPKLSGVFGNVDWTNKDRLPDHVLVSLIRYFEKIPLGVESVSQDDFGLAYEYLIKKFATDSGHTSAEFYANTTVVHLMTRILDIQPGETIYDPTCGTGGMLLNAVLDLRTRGDMWNSVRLFGQELNLLSSSIARMNMFLSDIEEFDIQRGDTLSDPKFLSGNNQLRQFDVILANPPYSIKTWDRAKFAGDPYGRNLFGAPSQGCADYAFYQHIIKSMDNSKGRAAMLWPHGVLFRDSEYDIRKGIIESDLIDSIISLGPNLFYNSHMQSCIIVLKSPNYKTLDRKGKILFINGASEFVQGRCLSHLSEHNLEVLVGAYHNPEEHVSIARLVDIDEIRKNNHNLSVLLYVDKIKKENEDSLDSVIKAWKNGRKELRDQTQVLLKSLTELGLVKKK